MDTQTADLKLLCAADYAAELARNGIQILPGAHGTFWVRYEGGAMVRRPTFQSAPPIRSEIQRVLWKGRAAVASFLLEPDEHHPANTWLYICRDSSYSIEKLSKPARRDIRRAQRNLQFGPVDWPTLLAKGLPAYRDTRTRVGLSDGTWDDFKSRFEMFSRNPSHYVFGAWNQNLLVAFMTLVVVDDWVEIEGVFSMNAHLGLCPNDGLVHHVLEHFLIRRGFQLVSYGLSSIQENGNGAGLHAYKQKVGFEARPVHRAFAFHPLLRPFANPLTLWSIKMALLLRPGARRLRKAMGVLSHLVKE